MKNRGINNWSSRPYSDKTYNVKSVFVLTNWDVG